MVTDMMHNGSLCPYVSTILIDRLDELDELRSAAQGRAAERFRAVGDIRRALEQRSPVSN